MILPKQQIPIFIKQEKFQQTAISKKTLFTLLNSFFNCTDLAFICKNFSENNCKAFKELFVPADPDYDLRSNRPFVYPKFKHNYEKRNRITRLHKL